MPSSIANTLRNWSRWRQTSSWPHQVQPWRRYKQATRTVPIVFAHAADPVGAGFVDSLARPGGNATGFVLFEYGISAKWLELLKEIAPALKRVAVLRDPTTAAGIGPIRRHPIRGAIIRNGGKSGELRDPGEIERGVTAFAAAPNGGLIITAAPLGMLYRELIIALAARHKLPAIYPFRFFVSRRRPGLLWARSDRSISARGRLCRPHSQGREASDLPVQAPTKYELVINLKTAKALGLDDAADAARPRRRGDRMKRREFISLLGSAAAWPLTARAQERERVSRVARVGILNHGAAGYLRVNEFRNALSELGYVEGRNLILTHRWADGRRDRLPGLAAELVDSKVDVIIALGPAVLAAKRATSTTPIVMAFSGDPVGNGVVSNLARPGGNITGFSYMSTDLAAKRLELLNETFSRSARIAILYNPDELATVLEMQETEVAARTSGVTLWPLAARHSDDLEGAFAASARERTGAMIVFTHGFAEINQQRIIELAARERLPTMYGWREFVIDGGLMSYGPNIPVIIRRAASYVDRILKGEKPGDLPIEQPTRLELIVNLKTARALNIDLPPTLLARADEVIE